jgi:anti-sigma factor ChrR (cupin superfamily)
MKHPSEEELAAYCEGSARADDLDRIERHVNLCSECCRAVAQIVRELLRKDNTQTRPGRKPTKSATLFRLLKKRRS